MKKLLEISSEERNRILEMHQNATRKNYLTEAVKTALGKCVVGFYFANKIQDTYSINGVFTPKEIIEVPLQVFNFDRDSKPAIFGQPTITSGGYLRDGQFEFNLKNDVQVDFSGLNKQPKTFSLIPNKNHEAFNITVKIKMPNYNFRAKGDEQPSLTLTFETNDVQNPKQTVYIKFGTNSGIASGAINQPK